VPFNFSLRHYTVEEMIGGGAHSPGGVILSMGRDDARVNVSDYLKLASRFSTPTK
jgi:hypothetical protein